MKISKIKIKNILGITETELDDKSVEITGKTGVGKSSVLDAIKIALSNKSNRDYVIRQGENEGEILIECDSGVTINRKKVANKSDVLKVQDNDALKKSPQAYLNSIFSELQLDPIGFINKSKEEQNRILLNLIEFKWDKDYIISKFGELPNVDYDKHILEVLDDIKSEKGEYFLKRQELNRKIRETQAVVNDIKSRLPENYAYSKWFNFDFDACWENIDKIKKYNDLILRAKAFEEDYQNKVSALKIHKEKDILEIKETNKEKVTDAEKEIIRLEELISTKKREIEILKASEAVAIKQREMEFNDNMLKLDSDMETTHKYSVLPLKDVTDAEKEFLTAKEMIKHLDSYDHMKALEGNIYGMTEAAKDLTTKLEIARNLPSEILKEAKMPIPNLTVENGECLINGLPVSNLSDGQKLKLSVEIAVSNVDNLKIILLDGTEKLDTQTRNELYALCKEKGLQFIATRTTDDNDIIITEL